MLNLDSVSNDYLLELVAARTIGYLAGYADCAAAREAEVHAAAVESVRVAASYPPRDQLEEIRGYPARARAIRDFWTLTGLRENRPTPHPIDPRVRQAFLNRCRASWGLPSTQEVAA